MGGIVRGILRRFREWDRATQIALVMAALVFIVMLVLGAQLPPESRGYALVGVIGVLVVAQLIVMWGNRGMVTSFTQAQRHYLAGDFEAARDALENATDVKANDYRARTLLGNIYRQLGDLNKSEEVLTQALQIAPNHHFVLYGFGRTLLVKGQYAEAAKVIAQAVAGGGPEIIRVDYAEAQYRLGVPRETLVEALHAAQTAAQMALETGDNHQALMVQYLLYRMGEGEIPERQLIRDGLPYWEAAAKRFAHTPYGAALADDVRIIRASDAHTTED